VVGNPRQSSKNGITTSNWARLKNQCDLGNAESWLVYVIACYSLFLSIGKQGIFALECDVCIGLFVFTLTRLKKKMNKIFTLRSPLYIKYPNIPCLPMLKNRE
jgi:hypothetical protein